MPHARIGLNTKSAHSPCQARWAQSGIKATRNRQEGEDAQKKPPAVTSGGWVGIAQKRLVIPIVIGAPHIGRWKGPSARRVDDANNTAAAWAAAKGGRTRTASTAAELAASDSF